MKFLLVTLAFCLFFFSCRNNAERTAEKTIEEIKGEPKVSNSDIIRNPVSANEPEDTVNVAKLVFEETTFDFGEVDAGEVVTHVYNFTNTGKVPLVINNARSTCGCTVPQWPKDPIAPGDKGQIEVKFNTKNKRNKQNKPVTITANTYPATTKVYLVGNVIGAEKDNTEAKTSKQ